MYHIEYDKVKLFKENVIINNDDQTDKTRYGMHIHVSLNLYSFSSFPPPSPPLHVSFLQVLVMVRVVYHIKKDWPMGHLSPLLSLLSTV